MSNIKQYNNQSFKYVALTKALEPIKDISYCIEEGGTIEYNSLTRLKSNCKIPLSIRSDEVLTLNAIRIFHVLNGTEECLGTFLIATPVSEFEGDVQSIECIGYSTLWRIANNSANTKYYVPEGTNCIAEV